VTYITSTRIRNHRPLGLPRRKIPPTTAQKRREAKVLYLHPVGTGRRTPRSRSEGRNSSSGRRTCTVRVRLLTTLLYPKSPPADGFVTRPDNAQIRQGWFAAHRFSGGCVRDGERFHIEPAVFHIAWMEKPVFLRFPVVEVALRWYRFSHQGERYLPTIQREEFYGRRANC
jgi:hypothetical protein